MTHVKKIFAIVLAMIFVLSCPACSCSQNSEPAGAAEAAEETAGIYEITSMITDGEETPAEDLELVKSQGLNCIITLNSDGTGVLELFGEKRDITWDEQKIYAGDLNYSYTLKDGELTITDGDSLLKFRPAAD